MDFITSTGAPPDYTDGSIPTLTPDRGDLPLVFPTSILATIGKSLYTKPIFAPILAVVRSACSGKPSAFRLATFNCPRLSTKRG